MAVATKVLQQEAIAAAADVVNISDKKGIFKKLAIEVMSNGANVLIKITIDGVVMFDVNVNDFINLMSGNVGVESLTNNFADFFILDYDGVNDDWSFVWNTSLVFQSSFRIEIYESGTVATFNSTAIWLEEV